MFASDLVAVMKNCEFGIIACQKITQILYKLFYSCVENTKMGKTVMQEIIFGKGRETNIYSGYNAYYVFFRGMIIVSSSNLLLYKILISIRFLPANLRPTRSMH
jgi:hypothetical protein